LVSIDLQDVKDPKINLEPTKLTFTGIAGGKEYHADLEFFKEIDPQV
jgi:prostaglandin-E synthase